MGERKLLMKECIFCSDEMKDRRILERGQGGWVEYEPINKEDLIHDASVFSIRDNYAVTEGHTLIIPRRHTADYFSMTEKEKEHANDLLIKMRILIMAQDDSVTGFNIGMNCGVSAGQTVAHAHIHLIPRRDGDMEDPKGGVRGVIPSRQKY